MAAVVSTFGPGNRDYDRLVAMQAMNKGTVVKFKNPPRNVDPESLWVVVNQGKDKVSVFPLGGSADGRYWRADPLGLEKVDINSLLGR